MLTQSHRNWITSKESNRRETPTRLGFCSERVEPPSCTASFSYFFMGKELLYPQPADAPPYSSGEP